MHTRKWFAHHKVMHVMQQIHPTNYAVRRIYAERTFKPVNVRTRRAGVSVKTQLRFLQASSISSVTALHLPETGDTDEKVSKT